MRRLMTHSARPRVTIAAALVALSAGMAGAQAQRSVDEHLARGRAASGKEFAELVGVTCDLVRSENGLEVRCDPNPERSRRVNSISEGFRIAEALKSAFRSRQPANLEHQPEPTS